MISRIVRLFRPFRFYFDFIRILLQIAWMKKHSETSKSKNVGNFMLLFFNYTKLQTVIEIFFPIFKAIGIENILSIADDKRI